MTEKEEIINAYIAMCQCCLLAEVMKDCPMCKFNIGLATKVEIGASQPMPLPAQLTVFELAA
jgi:hypothetical protein